MHLLKISNQEREQDEENLTFYRFIKLTEKRQFEKIWQIKNKIHMRKQIKEHINSKIHIIPTTLAQGIKVYRAPLTLNHHIESSRFPMQLTPTRRMHSEQMVKKNGEMSHKMPNLKLIHRRDQLNSIKQNGKNVNILDELYEKQVKLKRIRLSLPIDLNKKPQSIKNRPRYAQLNSQSTNHYNAVNPERKLKI